MRYQFCLSPTQCSTAIPVQTSSNRCNISAIIARRLARIVIIIARRLVRIATIIPAAAIAQRRMDGIATVRARATGSAAGASPSGRSGSARK